MQVLDCELAVSKDKMTFLARWGKKPHNFLSVRRSDQDSYQEKTWGGKRKEPHSMSNTLPCVEGGGFF